MGFRGEVGVRRRAGRAKRERAGKGSAELGAAGEGDAGDALEVGEELDGVPAAEEAGEVGLLAGADLEREQAGGVEMREGLRDEALVDGEAELAGEEGVGGFEVAHLRMEGRAVGLGDVGRVREDGVEGRRTRREGGEQIALEQMQLVADVVGVGVASGDGEGVGRDVDGGDLGGGELCGDGDGDGTGAGADVCEAEVPGCGCTGLLRVRLWEAGEGGLDKELGLRARDEDGGGDGEGEAEELLRAGDVLDGLARETAGDGLLEALLLGEVEKPAGVGVEDGARERQGVEEKQFGIAGGGGREIGHACESWSRAVQAA